MAWLEMALRLIDLGQPVFPLAPRSKEPLFSKANGGNGCKDATLDRNKISGWADKHPTANLGLATGHRCFVVDLDLDKDGPESWDRLRSPYGRLPETWEVATGSGGRHIYYGMPDFPVLNSRGKVGMGIDVRGVGGYVVVPPSIHPETKKAYEWDGLKEIEDLPIASAPAWLLDLIRSSQNGPAKQAASLPSQISEGSRNDTLFRMAAKLRRSGLSPEEIYAALCKANEARCSPSLPNTEVRRIADSAGRYRPAPAADVFRAPAEKQKPSASAGVRPLENSSSENGRGSSDGGENSERVELPLVLVGGRDLREEAEDSRRALLAANEPPRLFVQSGAPTEVVTNQKGRKIARPLTDASTRSWLTLSADYRRKTSKGTVACYPPKEHCAFLLTQAPDVLGFPNLAGLVNIPIIRADGQVCCKTGWDPVTGLYYAPAPGFEFPDLPDDLFSDHIDAARDLFLNQLLGEFSFVDEASKAGVLAAMFTAILRHLIRGPVPMAIITATAPGTGKTLIAELISILITGASGEMSSLGKDEEENGKLIAALASSPVVTFDNVSHLVNSPELCKALTEEQHVHRVFRTHEKRVIEIVWTPLMTGNNVRLGGDLPRRCYWIRLDAKTSTPFLRQGFKIADVKAWTLARRPQLLAALFTVARAWFRAGKPESRRAPLGSFEAWSRMVGGVLDFAGVPGFLANMEEQVEQADDEAAQWESFLLCLHEVLDCSFSLNDLYRRVRAPELLDSEGLELRAALPDYLGEVVSKDGFFQRRASKLFAQFAERRFGRSEIYLKKGGISHHAQMWRTVKTGELGELAGS